MKIFLILFLFIVPANAKEHCTASIYSISSSSNLTASGQKLNDNALTAAHKIIRFGRKVRVTNKANGQSVIVRINDRGPFIRGRCIDLTKASARAIGCHGLCKVIVEP